MTLDYKEKGIAPEDLISILWLDSPDSDEVIVEDPDDSSWSPSSIQSHIKDNVERLDYIVWIDRKTATLTLISRDGKLDGKIGKDSFKKWKIERNNHLYKKIEEEFREKWYGTILIQEYIDAWFPLPDFEYTTDFAVIKLLEKFWYKFFSVIDKNWNENPNVKALNEDKLKRYIQKWYVVSLIKSD